MRLIRSAILAATVALACQPAFAEKAKSILELRVIPSKLTLNDSRDVRRVIVTGRTADGFWVDLSDTAKVTPSAPLAKRNADGYWEPTKSGQCALSITAGGKSTTIPLQVKSVSNRPISYVREIQPLLSTTGCTAGTCHGAAKGKGGFKLSLRGYDPQYDYHALVQDVAGRRFNSARPGESLMLLKPTQGAAHQGGLVFEESSRHYKLMYQWIKEGGKADYEKVARANKIEVLPAAPVMDLPGAHQKLVVIAHYPDGTSRDVTRDSVYTSTMTDSIKVSPNGKLDAVRRGEAAILVRYEGNYAAIPATVIGDRTGWKWTPQPQISFIDKLVDAKLKKLKSLPSGLCTDAEFARRVYLDIVGIPPTPDDVRAFLADKSPQQTKRMALVDKLLGSSDYVEFWTSKWSDLLQVNRKYLGDKGVWKFRNWIKEQIVANRPYDAFVHDIMTASGSSYATPEASYFRVARDPNTATENVTQLFLGIRFSCNKCHDHPFERWTQTQYYEFAANFGRVGFKPGIAAGDETVYAMTSGEVTNPRSNKIALASFPYKVNTDLPNDKDRRERLATWLTSSKNQYFAASYVNRIWSYFLGKGIIDPVDDIRSSNPAVNPELLDALTKGFVKSGFDPKQLIRTICNSRTYQASVKTNEWNKDDQTNFSHAIPRRLTAEQLMDAISRTTGSAQRYAGVPAGFRAIELPDSTIAAGGFLDLFGRPPRESPCECERSSTVSLGQTLNLVNGPTIAQALIDPNGRVAQLVKTDPTPQQLVEEVFLATLCRMPSKGELQRSVKMFDASPASIKLVQERDTKTPMNEVDARKIVKREAAEDLMWALLNTPAFLFNR